MGVLARSSDVTFEPEMVDASAYSVPHMAFLTAQALSTSATTTTSSTAAPATRQAAGESGV
jgi:hypothetical protein